MGTGKVPGSLRARLGDDGTFGLMGLLDKERKDWKDDVLITATDRFERRLTVEIGLLRQEFSAALHGGLGAIRAEIATGRVEILRWSFLFWIGQLAAIAGLLAFMFRFAGR